MMKRIFTLLAACLLLASTASASILPPTGVDEEFYALTGIECVPAIVLCQSLSVHEETETGGYKKVDSIKYTGDVIPTIQTEGRYTQIYYEDGEKTGWVINEYLLFDPYWYVFDTSKAVYAYPDYSAPCVGWMSQGTELPIITEMRISGQTWYCLSLRGASGWVPKVSTDVLVEPEPTFDVSKLQDIRSAELIVNGRSSIVNDWYTLSELSALLTNVNPLDGEVAGCPFTAALYLTLGNGEQVVLQLATDSCCVYRVNGQDYQYARHLGSEADHPENTVLFDLFGLDVYGNSVYGGNG